MSCELRYDQCCIEDGCLRPARHGGLCVQCYMAADAAVRSCADLLDRIDAPGLQHTLEAVAGHQTPETQAGADAHRQAHEIRELDEMFEGGNTEPLDWRQVRIATEFEALMYDVPAWGEAA